MRFVYLMDPMANVLPDKDTTFAFQRAAQARGHTAKQEIEAMSAGARKQIEESTALLSEQILRAVLPSGTNLSEAR